MPPNSIATLQPPQYQMNKAPQPGMDSVLPPQQPAKIKKGVKRKADTTTPANSFEPYALTDPAKSAKIATRRESGRQVMKIGSFAACASYRSSSFFIFFIDGFISFQFKSIVFSNTHEKLPVQFKFIKTNTFFLKFSRKLQCQLIHKALSQCRQ